MDRLWLASLEAELQNNIYIYVYICIHLLPKTAAYVVNIYIMSNCKTATVIV